MNPTLLTLFILKFNCFTSSFYQLFFNVTWATLHYLFPHAYNFNNASRLINFLVKIRMIIFVVANNLLRIHFI